MEEGMVIESVICNGLYISSNGVAFFQIEMDIGGSLKEA